MELSQHGDEFMSTEEIKAWERLAHIDPASPALLILAQAYLAGGKTIEALDLAQRVRTAHPGHLGAVRLAAQALADLNRLDEARAVLDQAAMTLKDLAEVLGHLAGLFALTGDTAAEARAAEASKALSEERPETVLEKTELGEPVPTETLAALYLDQGHLDEAVRIYRQLVDQDRFNQGLKDKLAALDAQIAESALAEPGPVETAETEALSVEPQADEAKRRLVQRLERLKTAARRRREAVEAAAL